MTEIEIFLREALPEDFDFTFHVRRTAFGPYLTWDDEAELTRHRERFSRQEFRVVGREGERVGFLAFRWEPDCLHLFQLHILPQAQGQGVGREVLNSLQREARERNLPIELQVQKNNLRALRFYRRHGFVDGGENETHFRLKWQT